MTGWRARRFWRSAEAVDLGDGFTVRLDRRAIRTPADAPMVLPTAAMAEAVADEWNAQDGEVDPTRMPVTKSANSAIDSVTGRVSEIVGALAAYAETDVTCYRATEPEALVSRQDSSWDPLLDWALERFGVRPVPVKGVIHRPQSSRTLERLRGPLDAMDPFELTAMHDLVSLSGSLVIGLAVSDGHMSPEALWACSRIDEEWQAERWGEDGEAASVASRQRSAFLEAARFLDLARGRTAPSPLSVVCG